MKERLIKIIEGPFGISWRKQLLWGALVAGLMFFVKFMEALQAAGW